MSIFGQLALATAAAFTGAALYINVAEHPARVRLDPRGQLAQWKPSYEAALKMQVALITGSALLGTLAWWTSGDARWAVGAILMLANLPFTMVVIMPVNRILKATPTANAGDGTAVLLGRWARLHAARTVFGCLATAAYIWAAR